MRPRLNPAAAAKNAAEARETIRMVEGLLDTLDHLGWGAPDDLVIETTAARLSGDQADDEALEECRARLWPIWNARFCALGG